MAQFDANINLVVNAQKAYKQIADLENRLDKLSNPKTKRQVQGLITQSKSDLKAAEQRLANQVRLNAALERQANLVKGLNRAGVSGGRSKRVDELVSVGEKFKNNLRIQNAVNTALEKELQTLREINRTDRAQSATSSKILTSVKQRLEALKAVGATTSEITKIEKKRDALVSQNARKQTDLAKESFSQLNRQLATLERKYSTFLGKPGRQIASPIRGGKNIPGSPAYLEEQARAADKAAKAAKRLADQQLRASKTAGGPRSPIGGSESLVGSPKFLAAQAKKLNAEELKINKTLDDQRKLREKNAAAAKKLAATQARNAKKAEETAKRNRQNRIQGLQLGVGFPLLFGGGVGSVAGGALGALTDSSGGFGGQILFSAIGQQIDAFIQKTGDLGKALNPLTADLNALTTAAGLTGTNMEFMIKAIDRAGNSTVAQRLAAEQLAITIGDKGVQSLKDYGEAQQRLTNELTKAFTALSAAIAPTLAAIANFLASEFEKTRLVDKATDQGFGGLKASEEFKNNKELLAIIDKFNKREIGEKDAREAIAQLVKEIELGEQKILDKKAQQALYNERIGKYRQAELSILGRELELIKMTSEEDRYKKATLQAQLKVEQQRLAVRKALSQIDAGSREKNFDKELQGRKAFNDASAALKRAEAEKEVAEAAQQVYEKYTQQANALQTVVTQSKLRLNAEQAVADARNKLTGAFYSAELKVNQLAIQRAKQKGDTNQVLQLELRQVQLVYQQTVAQIQAEVERARIKARQVELATKELQVANLRKQAEDNLKQADVDAMKVQQQALAIARSNVGVAEQVAAQQIRGAQAVYTASREALIYANNQNKVANAAERTANAQARGANAVARAAKSAGNWGSNAPWGMGPGQVRGGFVQDFRRTARTSGMTKAQQDYTKRMIKAGLLSSTRIGAANYKKPLIGARGYAEGGYVTRPTQALVGERGENEYVIPESKMSSALGRYARGDRGDSVVQGATNAEGKSGGGRAVVNVNTGPVMRMNNKDYVTVNDMNSALGSVVSAMSPSGGNYNSSARLG